MAVEKEGLLDICTRVGGLMSVGLPHIGKAAIFLFRCSFKASQCGW